jgi:hypothetical protein
MAKPNEGIRRLSLAVGLVAAIFVFFADLIVAGSSNSTNPYLIPVVLIETAAAACAGWGGWHGGSGKDSRTHLRAKTQCVRHKKAPLRRTGAGGF